MADYVQLCIDDLRSKIEALQAVDTAFQVYDAEDLLDFEKSLSPPFVGCGYWGITPAGDDGRGLGVDYEFFVVVLGAGERFKVKCVGGDLDSTLETTTQFLHTVRQSLADKNAPTNHKWRFEGESPYDFGTKGLGFIQKWVTAGHIC